jgi:hypothetical protein
MLKSLFAQLTLQWPMDGTVLGRLRQVLAMLMKRAECQGAGRRNKNSQKHTQGSRLRGAETGRGPEDTSKFQVLVTDIFHHSILSLLSSPIYIRQIVPCDCRFLEQCRETRGDVDKTSFPSILLHLGCFCELPLLDSRLKKKCSCYAVVACK